jgi:hypothetical protein
MLFSCPISIIATQNRMDETYLTQIVAAIAVELHRRAQLFASIAESLTGAIYHITVLSNAPLPQRALMLSHVPALNTETGGLLQSHPRHPLACIPDETFPRQCPLSMADRLQAFGTSSPYIW